MTKDIQVLKDTDPILFSLQRQNEQGEAMVRLYQEMKGIKNDVTQMKSDIKEEYERFNQSVERMENSIELQGSDADAIKSIVHKKAHAIAKVKYPDIEEFGAEYRELVGYARREVYKNLKKHFNVNSYTRIRHLDAEKAIAFVESIVLGKSFLKNYEQWRMQRIKKRQREQEILKNEKGLN